MSREADKQRAVLAALNDAKEDRVVMNTGAAKDISETIARFNAKESADAAARDAREAELRGVKVSKEDVATLVAEFGMKSGVADRLLRVHKGSLEAAAKYLIFGDASIATATEAMEKIRDAAAGEPEGLERTDWTAGAKTDLLHMPVGTHVPTITAPTTSSASSASSAAAEVPPTTAAAAAAAEVPPTTAAAAAEVPPTTAAAAVEVPPTTAAAAEVVPPTTAAATEVPAARATRAEEPAAAGAGRA